MTNREIAQLLKDIAAAYEVKGEAFFKVAAYNNAADAIEHATSEVKDLWEEGKLDSLPGVGASISQHLDELFKTGKVKHFDQVKKDLPSGMFVINGIPGIGPKTAYRLASQLGVKTLDDLEKVARKGEIRNLEGFGQKSEEDILRSIGELRRRTGRVLLTFADENAQKVVDWMKKCPAVEKNEPLGSLRRMVATVGDIDLAAATEKPGEVVKHFLKYPKVARVIEAGNKSASVRLENGIQVDIKVVPLRSFGALLQHFTGSKHHNIALRELALKKGWSLSEYGIKIARKIHPFSTEESFYQKLGLDWIPPELREDNGEIEAALAHNLPDLVELEDIKGDVHLHSSFDVETGRDLGKDSFEDLIAKARQLGYEYLGFSEHTPGLGTHSAQQIDNLVSKHNRSIEQLKSSRVINILTGFEVDILVDGKLSLPDNLLSNLDFVIAGVHSSMRQTKEQMTKRILAAIENKYVNIIAHPTGRLLNEREEYEVDWEQIFDAVKEKSKILEINAWPARLDLPDVLVREAVKRGVKMIINTDSHAVDHLDNMRYGVSVARRGWAEKKDIVNTLSWVEFKKYFRVK